MKKYLDPKVDLTFKKVFEKVIEGLHFTFIELPKFQPHSILEKKMAVLWLKFLTEIDENTTTVPQELLDNPETSKALENVEESAMTKDELLAYDDFWDKLGAERLLFIDSNKISRAEGKAEGIKEGRAEGISETKIANAKRALALGLSPEQTSQITELPLSEVQKIAKESKD